jgi:hypothetical protein
VTTATESVPAYTFTLNTARRVTTITYIIAPSVAGDVPAFGRYRIAGARR